MILMQGKGVSDGTCRGTLMFWRQTGAKVSRREGCDPEIERARLENAVDAAAAQLEALAERCRRELGEETAQLFETHAMFLEDEDYRETMEEILRRERCSAEYAVQEAGEQFAQMFAAMEDSYMNAREADIRDVTGRLLRQLTGAGIQTDSPGTPVVLAADDLTPSETVQLDKSKILGFVLRQGSGSSHTAILARTMGIPAVCGLGDSLREEYGGREVWMDGETGQVFLEPDEQTQAMMQEKGARQKEEREKLESVRGKEDITLDGRRVHIYCNIASPEDVEAVLAGDGGGIGLFRSEFLYLSANDYPTEEEQFQAYSRAAAAMKGKRVIIRTLDIGADKQADYFGLKKEENPALGMRAVRICLNRPEVFRTQLRALYRASAYGKIAILFPMITSVWEVLECRRACQNVMQELIKEGIPFSADTELGIMIETPASVFMAEELAGLVDFFSVGTNDLTQYILACDRQAGDMDRFFDPHHPALLRALKMAADAAHSHGIWIGICGELAADMDLLPTFLALGIDELSVSPKAVLPLRAALRESIAKACTLDLLRG